jgi:hypothetical protein
MGSRKEQRTRMLLPVRIWGLDSEGVLFDLDARTIDVTPIGARLAGITCRLHRGAAIGVQCGNSKARFRVVWVGAAGGPKQDQIGIQLIDVGKYIWGKPLARTMGDDYGHQPAVTAS